MMEQAEHRRRSDLTLVDSIVPQAWRAIPRLAGLTAGLLAVSVMMSFSDPVAPFSTQTEDSLGSLFQEALSSEDQGSLIEDAIVDPEGTHE